MKKFSKRVAGAEKGTQSRKPSLRNRTELSAAEMKGVLGGVNDCFNKDMAHSAFGDVYLNLLPPHRLVSFQTDGGGPVKVVGIRAGDECGM